MNNDVKNNENQCTVQGLVPAYCTGGLCLRTVQGLVSAYCTGLPGYLTVRDSSGTRGVTHSEVSWPRGLLCAFDMHVRFDII